MRHTEVVDVATPEGLGRLFVDPADAPRATLMLGHGAGGGVTAADLELLARRLPNRGVTVVRFEQPWRTAGRRVAVPPPRLDVAWRAAVLSLRTDLGLDGPLLTGGRSAGARVACRTASESAAIGIVCLAFPLHLPGRPDRSRAPELLGAGVPRLVLQGTRDSFGSAADMRTAVAERDGVEIVALPGADHGFRLPKGGFQVPEGATFTPADLRDLVTSSVLRLVGRLVGNRGRP